MLTAGDYEDSPEFSRLRTRLCVIVTSCPRVFAQSRCGQVERIRKKKKALFGEVGNGHWSLVGMAFSGMSENLNLQAKERQWLSERVTQKDEHAVDNSLRSASRPGTRTLGSPL